MRSLAIALALLVSGAAHAEDIVLVPASLVPQVVDARDTHVLVNSLESRAQEGRVLRNSGIALTVIGTLFTAVGTGLLVKGICIDGCGGDDGSAFIAGTTLLTLAQVGVLAGIPMWAAGQHKVSRAEAAKLSLSATGATIQF